MPHTDDPTIGDKIMRRLRYLTVSNVVLGVTLILAVWYYAGKAAESHDALCNIRAGQVRGLITAQRFKEKHPEGAPAIGYSAKDVDRAIAEAAAQVKALDPLACPAVPGLADLATGATGATGAVP